MTATRTYSPTLHAPATARTQLVPTRRHVRYAEPHSVQPLKGHRETRAASVSYRASVPAGQGGRGATLSYRASSPDGESLPFGIEENPSVTSAPTANYSLLTANWTYTFSAKERDSETGLSYFGSRYYSSDLSIWLSVDPMSDKYPGESPYVYCYNNPIRVYDPNGEEGITISGSPGNHGNKLHFLKNGLNRAVQAKNHFQRKNETSTWIIYNDAKTGYTPELIKEYTEKAKKEGVNVIVVTDVKEIINYINKKDGNHSRCDDKITSFYYIGHATPGDLDVGYAGTGQNFDPSDLSPNAFSSGAYVDVVGGCRTAVPWLGFLEKSVVDQFAKILDKKSEIYGSDVRVQYNGGVMTNQQLLKENNGTVVYRKGERD